MFTHKMFLFPADDSIREKITLVGFEYIPLNGILENHSRGLREKIRLKTMQGRTENMKINDLRDQDIFYWRQCPVNSSL